MSLKFLFINKIHFAQLIFEFKNWWPPIYLFNPFSGLIMTKKNLTSLKACLTASYCFIHFCLIYQTLFWNGVEVCYINYFISNSNSFCNILRFFNEIKLFTKTCYKFIQSSVACMTYPSISYSQSFFVVASDSCRPCAFDDWHVCLF